MSIMDKFSVDRIYPHTLEGKHTSRQIAQMRNLLFEAVAHLDYAEKNPDFINQDFSKFVQCVRSNRNGFTAIPSMSPYRIPQEVRPIFKYEDIDRAWEYAHYITEGRPSPETRNSYDNILNFPTTTHFVSAVGDAPVDKRGKIVKRIRNFLYKEYSIELPDIFWEYFGQKVKNYGVIPQTPVWWRITHDLDWTAGDFGDDKSCVMSPGGAYAHTLGAMRAVGKFYAVQVFLSETPEHTIVDGRKKYANGMARAFLLQAADDLLVVFNAYIKPRWLFTGRGPINIINDIITPVLGPGIALSNLEVNGSRNEGVYINTGVHYAYGRRVPPRLDIEVPELVRQKASIS